MATRGTAKSAEAKPSRAKKAQGEVVRAIKGFDSNLQCLGYQFEVGKTYEHDGAVRLCSSGFHCTDGNPLDVLDFYPLIGENGSLNRFCSVVASGEIGRDRDSSKIVSSKLTVSVELTIPELIRKSVAFEIDACKGKSGDNIQAASGYSSKLAASGDSSKLAASGYSSKLAASGYSSKLAASGDYSQLEIKGASSAAAAVGPDSTVRAVAGTAIAICEYDRDGKPIGFATGVAGKDGVPADTWLIAKDGKLVEAA